MKRNAFTFLEILIVLIIVGALTIISLGGFKYTRDTHQVDSLIQELTLLRTAILSYKEMHGSLPQIEESALSSDNFNALKPFWYPFKPENSKILEDGEWWGKIGDEMTTFLAVKHGGSYFSFDTDILEKKFQKLCCINDTGSLFYILLEHDAIPLR